MTHLSPIMGAGGALQWGVPSSPGTPPAIPDPPHGRMPRSLRKYGGSWCGHVHSHLSAPASETALN